MIFLIIYIIGYVLNLAILIKFGKSKFGIDYDKPKDYANMEDWDSNAEAYVTWSFVWPMCWILIIFLLIFKTLVKITSYFIN